MIQQQLIGVLQSSQAFFARSTGALTEEHSSFSPAEGMFTAAQVVAHVALTIDWLMEGAFEREDGFDMDFEAHDREARKVTSLKAAQSMLTASFESACAKLEGLSEAELASNLPEGPVMGGKPRETAIFSIQEHTAHHRGALTVYARLVGVVPPMPYM